FIRKHKINTNLFGAPIIVDGIRYENGIAMHARTKISYQLNGGYSSFVTYYGIDKSVTTGGNAGFIILGDGKELLKKNLNGTDPLQFAHINISGINTLELIVDYGKNGSGGDHGLWALPRLIK
ncbi:MAG: NPCBM/NEW2 domain-containing protein, partial [Planctomycetes bacterium]|nr:NPCBM/NEW2 domain-containing protein [Planctomycetota bacterium]